FCVFGYLSKIGGKGDKMSRMFYLQVGANFMNLPASDLSYLIDKPLYVSGSGIVIDVYLITANVVHDASGFLKCNSSQFFWFKTNNTVLDFFVFHNDYCRYRPDFEFCSQVRFIKRINR